MAKPDEMQENIQLPNLKPQLLLDEATPCLIDEWQIAPKLWDTIRFEIDHRNLHGQFVLTGSAVPADRSNHLS